MTLQVSEEYKRIVISSTIVIVLFPLVFLLESITKRFWVAYIEETLIRFVPLVVSYYIYRYSTFGDKLLLGITTGLTYATLELIAKIMVLGFSPLMFLPFFFVHIVNGIIMSVIIGYSFETSSYVLLPLAWTICSLWHSLWNTTVGFI